MIHEDTPRNIIPIPSQYHHQNELILNQIFNKNDIAIQTNIINQDIEEIDKEKENKTE